MKTINFTLTEVPELPACDFCKKKQSTFVDGKTVHGVWAYMCKNCFSVYGIGLGQGKGQMFKLAGGK